ncbi:MAG: DUF4383 domain-containing protein [Solirubrobacterales bacterium]|jgi:hypothetical protein|nr:DUF4383 domain-containing protein [Solirubrobacterales bacterium]
MARTKESKGVSLAKGPVALLGLALLAYGITGLIFGGQSFSSNPVDGTINGEKWLGLEVNGWSNLLFIASGALLLFGSPLHWGAKTMSLIVGLALGAASVIALVDKSDVFGIFAANGLTKLVWGAASALLLVLALLPRVGGKTKHPETGERDEQVGATRRVERERTTVDREPVRERSTRVERDSGAEDDSRAGSRRVVAPADGSTRESRETTRRQSERDSL